MSVFGRYAEWYDLFYADKDYQGEARYVIDIARRHIEMPDATERLQILDLGCGTGRHAEQFAAAGCSVQGIDRSPEMVELARQRLRGRNAVGFDVGDAATVVLHRSFDLVVALFHVLSYQTEAASLHSFLRNAAAHLRPGGLLICDFWHGPGVLSDPPVTRTRRLSNNSLSLLRIAEPTLHASLNVVDVNYTLFHNRRGEQNWFCAEESHRMRYFFIPELTLLLELAGLVPVCYHPWLALDGVPDRSNWNAVLVGKKPLD